MSNKVDKSTTGLDYQKVQEKDPSSGNVTTSLAGTTVRAGDLQAAHGQQGAGEALFGRAVESTGFDVLTDKGAGVGGISTDQHKKAKDAVETLQTTAVEAPFTEDEFKTKYQRQLHTVITQLYCELLDTEKFSQFEAEHDPKRLEESLKIYVSNAFRIAQKEFWNNVPKEHHTALLGKAVLNHMKINVCLQIQAEQIVKFPQKTEEVEVPQPRNLEDSYHMVPDEIDEFHKMEHDSDSDPSDKGKEKEKPRETVLTTMRTVIDGLKDSIELKQEATEITTVTETTQAETTDAAVATETTSITIPTTLNETAMPVSTSIPLPSSTRAFGVVFFAATAVSIGKPVIAEFLPQSTLDFISAASEYTGEFTMSIIASAVLLVFLLFCHWVHFGSGSPKEKTA